MILWLLGALVVVLAAANAAQVVSARRRAARQRDLDDEVCAMSLEAEREHARLVELLRYRDELTALIVHDFKNPLAAVMTNVDLVRPVVDGDDRAALEDALAATRRLFRLTANLLDVARLEERQLLLKRAPVAVADLLERVAAPRRGDARRHEIAVDVEADACLRVEADADLLQRVLENVMDNALRYTPRRGRIVLGLAAEEARLRITVGNTGPAVPAAARELIFEKFGRLSPDVGRMNLGLGLYFCRLAAEAHGGRMWVEETPALPTLFCIELPRRAAVRAPTPARVPSVRAAAAGGGDRAALRAS